MVKRLDSDRRKGANVYVVRSLVVEWFISAWVEGSWVEGCTSGTATDANR